MATGNNELLWTKRFGEDLSKTWNLGDLMGISNEADYSAFLGITHPGDGKNYDDFFGKEIGIKESFDLDTGKIGFSDILAASANASVGIANSKNKNDEASVKAGLELKTGYNLGSLDFNLPLYADVNLGINNGELNFDINTDFEGGFFDYSLPYLYLNVAGILESDAALYVDGSIDYEYINLWKSFWNWKKEVNRDSSDFSWDVNLSNTFKHDFIDFDTRQEEQVVDWIEDKRVFTLGNSSGNKEAIDVSKYFDVGFELPDFADIDFERLNSLDSLLDIPDLNIDLKDSYVYSIKDEFKLLEMGIDLDQIINSYSPYPTSFASREQFKMFGEDVSYDLIVALIDADLDLNLKTGYQIDFGVTNLSPKIKVENGDWLTIAEFVKFIEEKNFSIGNKEANLKTVDALGDLAKDNKLDFEIGFDPELFVNVDVYIKPTVDLKGGIGEYKLKVDPLGKFGGKDQYLMDIPDANELLKLDKYSLFKEDYKRPLSKLGIIDDIISIPFSIPIDPIGKALGVKIYNGDDNANFYGGSDGSDDVNFKGGPDAGQLSLGLDDIDGGSSSQNLKDSRIYYDPFGNSITQFTASAGDVFILDSDVYKNKNEKAKISLSAVNEGSENVFNLKLQSSSSYNPAKNKTKLDSIEKILFSDELQASTQGIEMDFTSLDDFGDRAPYLFLGGSPPDEYATDLPVGVLTGTQGPDRLRVPIGYNRGAPYVLGDGKDVVSLRPNGQEFHDPGTWPYTPGTEPNFGITDALRWKNPYDGERDKILLPKGSSIYQDTIDLGDGTNSVHFESAPGTYDAFISSVNPGKITEISGDLSKSPHTLRIVNLGGLVGLSHLLPHPTDGRIYGIFSAGGNDLSVSGNLKDSEYTFVLETEALEKKIGVSDLSEVEIEIDDSHFIKYYDPRKSRSEPFFTLDRVNTDLKSLIIASADLAGSSARKEVGSEERYSLQSPPKQTYTLGWSLAENILIRGRQPNQDGAYRKVILKENIRSAVNLGIDDDIFDEVVFESTKVLDGTYWFALGKVNAVDFSSLKDAFDRNTELPKGVGGLYSSYIPEVIFTDKADTILNPESANISSDFNFTKSDLQKVKPFTSQPLESNFQKTSHAKYVPMVSYHLGEGDDRLVADANTYNFIYSDEGNNTIINPENNVYIMNAATPTTGDGVAFDGVTSPSLSDVVVYTEGSSQDYVIRASETYENAVEVTKADGTVDLLFGIGLIKFETEDVNSILVPDSVYNKSDKANSPILDPFGNDQRSRLFYSKATTTDSKTARIQLDREWAVDRVDLAEGNIRQPGQTPARWDYDLPSGLKEFSLPKEFLLQNFSDPDIEAKSLYTLDDLVISNLEVTQNGKTITANSAKDAWKVKLPKTVTATSDPIDVSYIITEPEGYSHLTHLVLNPTNVTDIEELETIFGVAQNSKKLVDTSEDNYLLGQDEEDFIRSQDGDDAVYAEGGDDKVWGNAGEDILSGGEGSDTMFGGTGDDFILGDSKLKSASGNQADVLNGDSGGDIISGGVGNDEVDGGTGNDSLEGGDGEDTLEGGGDADLLNGGDGDDLYILKAKKASGSQIIDTGGKDRLELEDVDLSEGGLAKGKIGFLRQGTDLVIDIDGDGKITTINQKSNKEVTELFEGEFSQLLDSQNGKIVITEELTINNFFDEKGNKGEGFIETVDNLTGEEIIDSLTNRNQGITKNGNNRRNTLRGSKLDDVLNGKGGSDKLLGNKGNDTLTGGNGKDQLNGGKGEDVLTGGKGKDFFIFTHIKQTDEITDFVLGQDQIVLDKSAFKRLKSSKGKSFSRKGEFAVVDDAAEVASSKAFIVYNENSGELFYNANGNKAGFGAGGGLFAKLDSAPKLGATDFRIQP
ncbi:MAG: calcium-binding protein [Cyanobacteriota bacterium]|nr:calcium-binding protein [Cyanobacteriota bacterium]